MERILEFVRTRPFFKGLDISQLKITRLGGWSNTSFKLDFGMKVFVLRENRVNAFLSIDREAEKEGSILAENLGIGSRILYAEPLFHAMEFIPHLDVLKPEECRDPSILQSIASTLKTLHQSKKRLPKALNPYERLCKVYERVVPKSLLPLPQEVPRLILEWQSEFQSPKMQSILQAPCHNDLSPYNILKTKSGIQLIDWEHAAMSDPAWDLAYLSAECRFSSDLDARLLGYYLNEPQDAFLDRFLLYKSLAHLWIVVWIYTQICSGNKVATLPEFLHVAQERLSLCIGSRGLRDVSLVLNYDGTRSEAECSS